MLVAALTAGDTAELAAQAEALAPAPVAPGERGELSLILLEAPARTWPLAVRIDEGEVEVVDDRLGWSAVVDPLALQPRLRVPFVAPAEPGRHEVRASLSYGVCGAQWCWAKRGQLRWWVEVVAPSEAPAQDPDALTR